MALGTIDEFRAQLIGGGARANQFKVDILLPSAINTPLDLRKTSFLVTAAQLPSMAIEPIEIPFRGRTIRIAGDRDFPDAWTVQFINDTDFEIRNAMEEWNNQINNLATGRGITRSLDYCADLTVSQLDRDDRILKQYKFINAWPESIAAIDLSTAATTELETFEVAFRYQHFLSSTVEEQGASFEVSASITATI